MKGSELSSCFSLFVFVGLFFFLVDCFGFFAFFCIVFLKGGQRQSEKIYIEIYKNKNLQTLSSAR